MFCEAYNQSLVDAAAGGKMLPALREHLASCDGCRATFAEEESLFASIDADVRAIANTDVPTTLIPRVHVALNNEHPQQSTFHKWIFAGALAACALVVAVTLQLKHHEVPTPNKSAGAQAPTLASPRPIESNLSAPPVMRIGPRRPNSAESPRSIPSDMPPSLTAEVLVPGEERDAFAKFLAGEKAVPSKYSTAILPVPEAPRDLAPLPPVEIASLKVLPLKGEEGSRHEF
ncbi:MAG TPA: hypothetical protein VN025_11915 [Candidatus Dormibacteraeota bacterium]|jgi:hypothetical protein|nr:hypothetical protein [Candidatus Dormibacteraeota bacterium]